MQRDPRKRATAGSENRMQSLQRENSPCLLKLEGKFEQSGAESWRGCSGTSPLWTPLTDRMLIGLNREAGNDSSILELHNGHVLITNRTIFQLLDELRSAQSSRKNNRDL